jgi:hypothetical protein
MNDQDFGAGGAAVLADLPANGSNRQLNFDSRSTRRVWAAPMNVSRTGIGQVFKCTAPLFLEKREGATPDLRPAPNARGNNAPRRGIHGLSLDDSYTKDNETGYLSKIETEAILPKSEHRNLYQKLEELLHQPIRPCLLNEGLGGCFENDHSVSVLVKMNDEAGSFTNFCFKVDGSTVLAYHCGARDSKSLSGPLPNLFGCEERIEHS